MTYKEMNQFILNYLKNDKTGRAIMLTGEWGSGKSYYVQNSLISYLANPDTRTDADTKADADNEKYKTIVVSLYGMKSVSEISKAIYIEAKWDTIIEHTPDQMKNNVKQLKDSKSEIKAGVLVGAKTILKGVTSFLNIDISGDEKNLSNLYQSIKLENTLIILEDIERTGIDIIELLGFINSMCETDGAKLLLITNEAEILTKTEIKIENEKSKLTYTERAAAYIKAKEKSVGDTIAFACDYNATIKSILEQFEMLKDYNNEQCYSEIEAIFNKVKSSNLRAFIYACQKSSDIFQMISENELEVNDEIKRIIFYGIIAFTQRLNKNGILKFEANSYLSGKLGVDNETPLFRFCYDYIVHQVLSVDEIERTATYYSDYLKTSEWNSEKDSDLKTIKYFYINSDDDVKAAIYRIANKITDNLIPYSDFGILANYLVLIKYDVELEFDIDRVLSPIMSSLQTTTGNIKVEALFNSGCSLQSRKALEEFEQIKQNMKKAIEMASFISFSYNPNDLAHYLHKYDKGLKQTLEKVGFAHTLDLDQFIIMLQQCTSEQIDQICTLFSNLYSHNISKGIQEDIPVLSDILTRISSLCDYEGYGHIQKWNMKKFVSKLNEICHYYSTLGNR